MATIIKIVSRHVCQQELRELNLEHLGIGSIARCSCGNFFKLSEDQRDGPYWKLEASTSSSDMEGEVLIYWQDVDNKWTSEKLPMGSIEITKVQWEPSAMPERDYDVLISYKRVGLDPEETSLDSR